MSVYDLDGGPNNDYVERVVFSDKSDYAYYVTPLKPASGNPNLESTIEVSEDGTTFSSSRAGDPGRCLCAAFGSR